MLATSDTFGTDFSSNLRNQSCRERSSPRSCLPVRSTSAYWYIQPTLLASGPSDALAEAGSRAWTWFRYSSTRERAQYGSVPSSKMTYTKESPKYENPRTVLAPGTDSIVVVSGYVIWFSTICGAWPG